MHYGPGPGSSPVAIQGLRNQSLLTGDLSTLRYGLSSWPHTLALNSHNILTMTPNIIKKIAADSVHQALSIARHGLQFQLFQKA